jgi:hypothetical protein
MLLSPSSPKASIIFQVKARRGRKKTRLKILSGIKIKSAQWI